MIQVISNPEEINERLNVAEANRTDGHRYPLGVQMVAYLGTDVALYVTVYSEGQPVSLTIIQR